MAIFPQLIPPDAIDTTVPPDEFQQSFADTMGNAATDSDGFAAIFNDTASALNGVDSVLSALAGHAADFAFAFQPLSLSLEADAAGALADTISQGQPAFDTFSAHLTVPGSTPQPGPAPAPAPAPVSPCPLLDFGSLPSWVATVGSPAKASTINLKNTTGKAFTIKSTTFAPDEGFTWSVNPSVAGKTVQAGTTFPVRVVFQAGSVGKYDTVLTIHTDAPDPQPCVELKGSVFQGTGGGLLPTNPIGIIKG